MKKKILGILVCGFLVLGMTGCGNNETTNQDNKNESSQKENVQNNNDTTQNEKDDSTSSVNGKSPVIKLDLSDVGSTSSSVFQVRLYDNKIITYGYSNEKEVREVQLTDEQYNEIINIISSDSFKNMKVEYGNGDSGTHFEFDLDYQGYTVNYSGDNIKNSEFLVLWQKLLKYNA